MQYLQPALYAEGPADYSFLMPLLRRLCDEVCMSGTAPVDVADVVALDTLAGQRGLPRAVRIANAAIRAKSAWNILFVHADADSDGATARAERVEPGLAAIRQKLGGDFSAVAVIPVRSTDAWALADGDALRRVYGVTHDDQELGVPLFPKDVERLADPKAALALTFELTRPNRSRARRGVVPFIGLLGEEVSMQRLHTVPAFAQLAADLRVALVELRVLEA